MCLSFLICLGLSDVSLSETTATPPMLVVSDLRTVDTTSSTAEANAFSQFIRQEISQTGSYRVMGRNTMLAILKQKRFKLPCFELACFTEMGKILNADLILAGNIHREGDSFEITLRLVDNQASAILNTVHQSKPSIREKDLFGDWGRGVIEKLFQIEGKPSAAILLKPDGTIPERIRFKYPGMIYIPEGRVYLGSELGDKVERPVVEKRTDAFYIGKFEVTNAEYQQFVRAKGYDPPLHWVGGAIPIGLENHPVVWVSYVDAEAYCQWKGVRLPTESEWERAAKADRRVEYPWGDTFDLNKANTWENGRRGTTPVGLNFRGASPFGVEDMAGNAFEWVDGFFESHTGRKVSNVLFDQHLRVLKGGSWNFSAYYARSAHRFPRSGGERGRSYGFRIARDS